MEELEITQGDSPEQDPRSETTPVPVPAPAEALAEAEAEAEPEPQPERELEAAASHQVVVMEAVLADDLLISEDADSAAEADEEVARLKAVVEALVYVAEDPITVAQVAASLEQPVDRIKGIFDRLIAEYDMPGRGIQIREVAGGYRMATKAEHHDAVRAFVKSLKPPLKLSLPALETLAVIAYKQPVTAPEVKEIRGVQGTGVLSTLLDRKLIAEAGRKNVIGKPILYKTTREFLIQFGLKDLSELPTLKEFEEIRRMAFADSEPAETPMEAPMEAPIEAPAEAEPPVAATPVEAPPEPTAQPAVDETQSPAPPLEPEPEPTLPVPED